VSDAESAASQVTSPDESPSSAEPPLPRPATWTVKSPVEPWCPPEVEAAIAQVVGRETSDRLRARQLLVTALNGADVDESALSQIYEMHTSAWRVVGAARRGRRHAHVGAWCEDAVFAHLGESRGVLVVADGAGSAAWSRLGSAIAVDMVGAALRDAPLLDSASMNSAIEAAVQGLRQCATAMSVAPRTLRTTLLAVAWEPSGSGGVRLVTTQVGDGVLVLAHADGRITQPAAGDAGEWSGEVHCFLPDDETMSRARAATAVHDIADLTAVLLVTDGVEDALYPFAKHAPAVLSQLVHGASVPLGTLTAQPVTPSVLTSGSPGLTLLEWLAFEKRGENDDRTLAVALHHTASLVITPWAPSASA